MVDGGKEALQDVEADQKVTDSKQDKKKVEQEESVPEKKDTKGKSKQTTVESDDESKSGDRSQDHDGRPKLNQETETEKTKAHSWQAVWDASRGAWYFWNAETQETTWENPLTSGKGKEENGKATSVSTTQMTDAEIAEMCGIDPDLAYLDPAMYAKEIYQARIANNGSGTSTSSSSAYRVAGSFDSRTGKFVSQPQQTSSSPGKIHHRQADRQLNAFFDVKEFEQKRKREHQQSSSHQETDEQGRIKRQRPTKKEVKFFKERAKEKKATKHAWLRN